MGNGRRKNARTSSSYAGKWPLIKKHGPRGCQSEGQAGRSAPAAGGFCKIPDNATE